MLNGNKQYFMKVVHFGPVSQLFRYCHLRLSKTIALILNAEPMQLSLGAYGELFLWPHRLQNPKFLVQNDAYNLYNPPVFKLSLDYL